MTKKKPEIKFTKDQLKKWTVIKKLIALYNNIILHYLIVVTIILTDISPIYIYIVNDVIIL